MKIPPLKKLNSKQSLCTQCGLCCNGTIFDYVPMEKHETTICKKADIPFERDEDGDFSFNLPCPAFKDCCTIYNERFKVCREFECKLLNKSSKKQISHLDALSLISLTKELHNELQNLFDKTTAIPKSALLSVRYRALIPHKSESIELRKKHGVLITKYHSFLMFLEKNFGYTEQLYLRKKL